MEKACQKINIKMAKFEVPIIKNCEFMTVRSPQSAVRSPQSAVLSPYLSPKEFSVFISHVIKATNRNRSINRFKNLGYDR